jgi:hypothetical protein
MAGVTHDSAENNGMPFFSPEGSGGAQSYRLVYSTTTPGNAFPWRKNIWIFFVTSCDALITHFHVY